MPGPTWKYGWIFTEEWKWNSIRCKIIVQNHKTGVYRSSRDACDSGEGEEKCLQLVREVALHVELERSSWCASSCGSSRRSVSRRLFARFHGALPSRGCQLEFEWPQAFGKPSSAAAARRRILRGTRVWKLCSRGHIFLQQELSWAEIELTQKF